MSIAHPIRRPSQMHRPLVCKPMDKAWKESLKDRWWSTNSIVKPANEAEAAERLRMFALRDKILSFGGEEVCMAFDEEDYDAIMQRGQLFYGNHAQMKPIRKSIPPWM